MKDTNKVFEKDQKVRVKSTDEILTIKRHWKIANNPGLGIQYDVVEHPSTWYFEHELEEAVLIEAPETVHKSV